jgi:hypothetical protein
MAGRTRATLGDLGFGQGVIDTLEANAEASAQQDAINEIWALYDEYTVEVWTGGSLLAFWILWVSYQAAHVDT